MNNVTSISSSLVSVWPNNIHIEVTYIYIYLSRGSASRIAGKRVGRQEECWSTDKIAARRSSEQGTGGPSCAKAHENVAGASWSLYITMFTTGRVRLQLFKAYEAIFRPSTVVSPWTGYDRVLSGNASPTGKPSLLPWPLPVFTVMSRWCCYHAAFLKDSIMQISAKLSRWDMMCASASPPSSSICTWRWHRWPGMKPLISGRNNITGVAWGAMKSIPTH